MNGPRNEFLAGAAFPEDHNRGMGGGGFEYFCPQFLHRWMRADKLISFLRFFPQIEAFPSELVLVQRIADGQ
ncbi:MAG: hypothetical protein WCC06_02540 [Candidatus Aminicenantales bacterium]